MELSLLGSKVVFRGSAGFLRERVGAASATSVALLARRPGPSQTPGRFAGALASAQDDIFSKQVGDCPYGLSSSSFPLKPFGVAALSESSARFCAREEPKSTPRTSVNRAL